MVKEPFVFAAGPGTTATGENTSAAARSLGLQLLVLRASSDRDFDAVFASLLQQRAGALLMSGPAPQRSGRAARRPDDAPRSAGDN